MVFIVDNMASNKCLCGQGVNLTCSSQAVNIKSKVCNHYSTPQPWYMMVIVLHILSCIWVCTIYIFYYETSITYIISHWGLGHGSIQLAMVTLRTLNVLAKQRTSISMLTPVQVDVLCVHIILQLACFPLHVFVLDKFLLDRVYVHQTHN